MPPHRARKEKTNASFNSDADALISKMLTATDTLTAVNHHTMYATSTVPPAY